MFAGEVKKRAAKAGGTAEVEASVTQELAQKFDEIHSVERAKQVGSIDDIITAASLRPFLVEQLRGDYDNHQKE